MDNNAIKNDLFKKITECQRQLDRLESSMNSDASNREKYEQLWGKFYGIQKDLIKSMGNVDELDKAIEEANALYNGNVEEKEEVVEEVNNNEIEDTQETAIEPSIELPQVEEETPIEIEEQSIELPQAEETEVTPIEEPVQETEVTEVEPVLESVTTPAEEPVEKVEEIPVTDTTDSVETAIEKPAEEETKSSSITYINNTNNPTPGRKISVNKKQKDNLSNSREENSTKITELYGKSEESMEQDPEKQIEAMLNQQRELYNNGEIEKAEAISNDISVLTKKISNAATA